MIHWRKPFYRPADMTLSTARIRLRFKMTRFPISLYMVILPDGRKMPEIVNAAVLKLPWYKKYYPDYDILGAAFSKNGAVGIVSDMVTDAFKLTGSPDIRLYYDTVGGHAPSDAPLSQ